MGTDHAQASPLDKVSFPVFANPKEPAYEVVGVTIPAPIPDELGALELKSPQPGGQRHVHTLAIDGRVLGRHSRAVEVWVYYDNQVIRVAPVYESTSAASEMLGEAAAESCNFRVLLGLVGHRLSSRFDLCVRLEDETMVPIGSVALRRRALHSGFEPTVQPLMVTGLGRSGTTWLMKMLSAHPDVVVFDRFPYEHSMAKYWLHMVKVLSEPSNELQSALPHKFQNEPWWVGHNPFYDHEVFELGPLAEWLGRSYPKRLAAFAQSNIEEWYQAVAHFQGRESPTYFAEKHAPDYMPAMNWELYPRAKEVFLVRDFRDFALSVLAFDQKRGFPGFGRPEGWSDEKYVRRGLRFVTHQLRDSWRERHEQAHLVHYEDLVLRPLETLTAVLAYLELDSSRALIDTMLREGSEKHILNGEGPVIAGGEGDHRTSSDAAASIGRWRRDGDESFKRLCDEAFGDVLPEFGYTDEGYEPAEGASNPEEKP